MTSSDDPLAQEALRELARYAGLNLTDEDWAVLEPGVRRTLGQAKSLRDLALAPYEPGVVFPSTSLRREGHA